MNSIQFGTFYTLRLETRLDDENDEVLRREFCKEVGNTFYERPGITYALQDGQISATEDGKDHLTEVTIDTGNDNPDGDEFVRQFLERWPEISPVVEESAPAKEVLNPLDLRFPLI